ncbi:MAG: hypothetical protein Kow0080_18420 [Candidatus Promineifilaceae bacterium]
MTELTATKFDTVEQFYEFVQANGSLRTLEHAKRYTSGVLRTLGLYLKGSPKKVLAKALPEELAFELTRPFFLAHFPDKNIPWAEFTKAVARRSGNSDSQFARIPTRAVFRALHTYLDANTAEKVANALSPEVRAEWEQARS